MLTMNPKGSSEDVSRPSPRFLGYRRGEIRLELCMNAGPRTDTCPCRCSQPLPVLTAPLSTRTRLTPAESATRSTDPHHTRSAPPTAPAMLPPSPSPRPAAHGSAACSACDSVTPRARSGSEASPGRVPHGRRHRRVGGTGDRGGSRRPTSSACRARLASTCRT